MPSEIYINEETQKEVSFSSKDTQPSVFFFNGKKYRKKSSNDTDYVNNGSPAEFINTKTNEIVIYSKRRGEDFPEQFTINKTIYKRVYNHAPIMDSAEGWNGITYHPGKFSVKNPHKHKLDSVLSES